VKRLVLRRVLAAATLVLTAGMSVAALADYGISGVWYGNRGATFNIPNLGGFDVVNNPNTAATVNGGTAMTLKFSPMLTPNGAAHVMRTPQGIAAANWVPGPDARHQIWAQGQANAVRPAKAGAGGNNNGQIVAGVGTSALSVGGSFVVPAKLINTIFTSHVPVALNPVVQQVDTLFNIQAPATSRNPTTGGAAGPIASHTRKMQANAWMGAGQPSRLNADFTFTTTMGSPGPISRQVRQSAGPNAFGGTMTMLISGGGAVWVGPRELITVVPGLEVLKSPIGRGASSLATGQAPGKAYSGTNLRIGQQGVIYLNYNIPTPCTPPLVVPAVPAGCGLFTGVAAPVALLPAFATPNGTGGVGTNPATNPNCPNGLGTDCFKGPLPTSINIGFPFTSGHVSVFVSGTRAMAPQITTITAVGNDTTSGGVRTVQLVGGAVSLRTTSSGQTRSAQLDLVTITLPEPGESLMLAGALGLIAGLYGLRRRLF